MAYSNHTWMFSNDQVSEMMATLNGYRSNLKNSDVSVNCTGIVSNNNIDNNNNNRFNIYPNPSNGKFIVMTENNVKIEILNILGNIIYQSNNSSTQEIDLSFVENGIYIININSENERFTEKIIINR